MPVHRAPGGKRSGVFAYAEELDAWLNPAGPANVDNKPDNEHGEREHGEDAPRHAARTARAVWMALGGAALIVATLALLLAGPFRWNKKAAASSRPFSEGARGKAEQSYERGRYFWNLRTADGLAKAVGSFEQAIAEDPSYAEAYAGLAESYDLLHQFANADLGESLTRAEKAADRAIALNPRLASAHRAKAFALFYWDWDIAGSDAEFRQALELDPDSAQTHQWYASTLQSRREGAECLRQIGEALRLDPASPAIATDAAFFEADFGDFDAGVRRLREIAQTQPTLLTPALFLREIDFDRGDFPAYIADVRRLASVTGTADDAALADAVARGWERGGKRGLLEARLEVSKAAFARGTESGYSIGQTLLLLGRPKDALPYFRAALKKRDIPLITMEECEWARQLGKDPGYAALFAEARERMHGGHPAPAAAMPVSFRLPE